MKFQRLVRAEFEDFEAKRTEEGYWDRSWIRHGAPVGRTAEAVWSDGASEPRDIVFGDLDLTLISGKVESLLRREGLSGWETFEVKLAGKNSERIVGYSGLKVVGRCGSVDFSRYKRMLDDLSVGFEESKGIDFDSDSWDGSDFFLPQNADFLLVSERVVEAFNLEKISGCSFEDPSEAFG